jgi:hypothetical protein
MFKKRQIRNENTAALPIDLPRPAPAQTVHNYAPSEAGRIFAKWIVWALSAGLSWLFLRYLIVEGLQYRNPERFIAYFLFGGAGLLILSYAADRTFTKWRQMEWNYRLQLAEIQAETARSLSLTAGAPALPAERLTGEQKRLFENLALVMRQAYQDYAEKGNYQGGGDKRPWSKRSILAMTPPRYGKMPDSKTGDIRAWLVSHQVIVGEAQSDQINTELYPAWADFMALLEEEFNMPVRVGMGGGPSPTSLIGRYTNIDI